MTPVHLTPRHKNRLYHLAKVFSPPLAVLWFCSASAFSFLAERDRAQSVVANGIKQWLPELAGAYAQKDWLTVSKLGRSFAVSPIRSLNFSVEGRTVYSFPLETDPVGCRMHYQYPLQQYGATFGAVDACFSGADLLLGAIKSPLFVSTAASLLLIIAFAALLPVISLRRGLTSLVEYLAEWSTSLTHPHGHNGPLKIKGNTALEDRLQELVESLVQQRVESERRAIRDETIRDVAHNIGSPIASLAIRIQTVEGLTPDGRATLTEGLAQLGDMVNQIKSATAPARITPPNSDSPMSPSLSQPDTKVEMLSALIDDAVSEKRFEKNDRSDIQLAYDIRSEGYGAFAAIKTLDFRAVLSNLLNNAYDAIVGPGMITVRLVVKGSEVKIEIQDTGKGIPESVLCSNETTGLFSEGFSLGKSAGSGRGLFHARKTLSPWGGRIALVSSVGKGTTVTIHLPLAPAPSWFLGRQGLSAITRVVVLDDDPSIHALWRYQYPHLETVAFSEPVSFRRWLSARRGESAANPWAGTLFMVDFRLGPNAPNGLDIVEEDQLAEHAVLVTNDASRESVKRRCELTGTKLLWKSEVACLV